MMYQVLVLLYTQQKTIEHSTNGENIFGFSVLVVLPIRRRPLLPPVTTAMDRRRTRQSPSGRSESAVASQRTQACWRRS